MPAEPVINIRGFMENGRLYLLIDIFNRSRAFYHAVMLEEPGVMRMKLEYKYAAVRGFPEVYLKLEFEFWD
jgi:hypothetical protein